MLHLSIHLPNICKIYQERDDVTDQCQIPTTQQARTDMLQNSYTLQAIAGNPDSSFVITTPRSERAPPIVSPLLNSPLQRPPSARVLRSGIEKVSLEIRNVITILCVLQSLF